MNSEAYVTARTSTNAIAHPDGLGDSCCVIVELALHRRARIDEPGHRKKSSRHRLQTGILVDPILREKSFRRGLLVHSRSLSRILAPWRPWSRSKAWLFSNT